MPVAIATSAKAAWVQCAVGQQGGDAALPVGRDAVQHVTDVRERLHAVTLARGDQGVDDGGASGAWLGSSVLDRHAIVNGALDLPASGYTMAA